MSQSVYIGADNSCQKILTEATAANQVTDGMTQLVGFYVNSTDSGTLVLKDGDSNGRVVSGTITPAIGFHFFPVTVSKLHVTTGGTAINATFFYQLRGTP